MNLFRASPTTIKLKHVRGKKKTLKVVITGGTKGLGRAMTKKFVETGDDVFVIARNALSEDYIDHKLIRGYNGDIGKSNNYPIMFDNILKAFDGEIDIFVPFAGSCLHA